MVNIIELCVNVEYVMQKKLKNQEIKILNIIKNMVQNIVENIIKFIDIILQDLQNTYVKRHSFRIGKNDYCKQIFFIMNKKWTT